MAKRFLVRAPSAGNVAPIDQTGSIDPLIALAAAPFVESTSGGAGPAATVAITTGTIARNASGSVFLMGTITGVASAAAIITVSLLRDGLAVPGAPTYQSAVAAGDLSFAIPGGPWVDTLPDDANHTYAISATASAGNLTLTINQGSMVAVELG